MNILFKFKNASLHFPVVKKICKKKCLFIFGTDLAFLFMLLLYCLNFCRYDVDSQSRNLQNHVSALIEMYMSHDQ